MHPILQRQLNPRRRHRRRVVLGRGYWTWPQYYWPYYWPGYQQPTVERIVCERIAGSQECPDGTVVQTNDDGSKTCCPPQPQTTQATYGYGYGYPYSYGYTYPWWARRRW